MYYKLVLYFDAFTHQSNAGNRICIFGVNLAEPIDFNGKIKFYAPRTFFYFYFFKYASHKKNRYVEMHAIRTMVDIMGHLLGTYTTIILRHKNCVNIAQGYVQTPVFSCRKLQRGKTA